MNTNINFRGVVLSALVFALTITAGCKEKDVPYIVDADEIRRYINEVETARELFRTSNLINPDPYTLPFDSVVYRDTVLAVTRQQFEVVFPGDLGNGKDKNGDYILADYGSLGFLREAMVVIEDRITVQTLRLYNGDTLQKIISDRRLKRHGFFIKLGSDSHDYVGWLLWGFNGADGNQIPLIVTVKDSQNNTYYGDGSLYTDSSLSFDNNYYFKRLSGLNQINSGSNLVISTETANPSISVRRIPFISAEDKDGYFTRPMIYNGLTFDNRKKYVDTISTPYETSGTWKLIFMQVFKDDEFFFLGCWGVPYRVK